MTKTATTVIATTVIAIPVALAVTLTEPLPPYLTTQQIAFAHQVELAEDVGATLHIEPNDTPRAGEEVLAWFALTKRGGQLVPLSECDCQIEIFAQSDQMNPIASPTAQAVDSEGYQGIPGAEFTFPNVGAYTLVVSGRPRADASFSPFELAFDVTVAAGTSANGSTDATASTPAQSAPLQSAPLQSDHRQTDEEIAEAESESSLSLNVATPTVEESTGETGKLIGLGIIGIAMLGAIALKLKR